MIIPEDVFYYITAILLPTLTLMLYLWTYKHQISLLIKQVHKRCTAHPKSANELNQEAHVDAMRRSVVNYWKYAMERVKFRRLEQMYAEDKEKWRKELEALSNELMTYRETHHTLDILGQIEWSHVGVGVMVTPPSEDVWNDQQQGPAYDHSPDNMPVLQREGQVDLTQDDIDWADEVPNAGISVEPYVPMEPQQGSSCEMSMWEDSDSAIEMIGDLRIGDRVVWPVDIGNPLTGSVKWLGMLTVGGTAGIEFDQKIHANENGAVNEDEEIKSLFPCKDGHGRLVPIAELMKYQDFFPADDWEIDVDSTLASNSVLSGQNRTVLTDDTNAHDNGSAPNRKTKRVNKFIKKIMNGKRRSGRTPSQDDPPKK